MQEKALRKVLLIQAIEETDRTGEVLPVADRMEATRAVIGSSPPSVETQAEASLSSATEWFLIQRADILLRTLRARSPGIDQVLAVAGGATALDRGTLVLAFAAGVTLSFLDGGRTIDIFAFPLIGLIAWNVLVYLFLLTGVRGERKRTTSWFGSFYARSVRKRTAALLGHSTRFNAPLAPGLRRFAADWWEVAQPVFFKRARRLLHGAAALAAVGLIVGYYARGFVLRSAAGWESGHFLVTHSAPVLLMMLYGPASVLTGVAIPSVADLEALRGSTAWLHLIAGTAGLYIVLPRLVLVLVSTLGLWKASRRLVLPAGLSGYVRTLFASARAGVARN